MGLGLQEFIEKIWELALQIVHLFFAPLVVYAKRKPCL